MPTILSFFQPAYADNTKRIFSDSRDPMIIFYDSRDPIFNSRDSNRLPKTLKKTVCTVVFFKESVRYPVWICRDPIYLILGTRFSQILGTR